MRIPSRAGLLGLAIGVTGCAGDGRLPDWFSDRPARDERRFDLANAPAASAKAATRVHAVGSAVVAANAADFATKPVFLTIGVPEPMIFHQSGGDIVVSEGLVAKCATDAELAAVIAHELGKMAADKAEKSAAQPADRELPPAPRLTSDVVGGSMAPDMTRQAEEALYDRRTPRGRTGPAGRSSRPDPGTLARNYLARTEYDPDTLGRIETFLKEAEVNADKRDLMRGR